MDKEDLVEDLYKAIIDLDTEKGKRAASRLIQDGHDPVEAIEKGLSRGMKVIGEKFSTLEIFLPDLLAASEIFNSAMEIMKPYISTEAVRTGKKGTVVIGKILSLPMMIWLTGSSKPEWISMRMREPTAWTRNES